MLLCCEMRVMSEVLAAGDSLWSAKVGYCVRSGLYCIDLLADLVRNGECSHETLLLETLLWTSVPEFEAEKSKGAFSEGHFKNSMAQ